MSVRELAEALDVGERDVRQWAHDNDVPRAGNAFAFNLDDAQALAADLHAEDPADSDDDTADEDSDADDEDDGADADDDEAEDDPDDDNSDESVDDDDEDA